MCRISAFRPLIAVVLLVFMTAMGSIAHAKDGLVVFAPSSMSDILTEIASAFEGETGTKVIFSFAGTPQIARQLDAGAPAGYFISADREWMDWVLQRNLVVRESVRQIAGNSLVLAVRSEVENWADPDALLISDRFAMAEPDTVPAGRYAKQALQKRGIWEKAQPMAVYGDSVRVSVKRLAMGEVGSAIVYGTDVVAEPRIRVLMTFPADSHALISYWGAVTVSQGSAGQGDAARDFADFLAKSAAGALLAKAGFLPPPRDTE